LRWKHPSPPALLTAGQQRRQEPRATRPQSRPGYRARFGLQLFGGGSGSACSATVRAGSLMDVPAASPAPVTASTPDNSGLPDRVRGRWRQPVSPVPQSLVSKFVSRSGPQPAVPALHARAGRPPYDLLAWGSASKTFSSPSRCFAVHRRCVGVRAGRRRSPLGGPLSGLAVNRL